MSQRVYFLNRLVGLPSKYRGGALRGGPDAGVYLLDHNYLVSRRAGPIVADMARQARHRGLDFSSKVLLLAADGLQPTGAELLAFSRQFRSLHVFFELWNGIREVRTLAEARLENLSFLPVTAALQKRGKLPHPALRPNREVFVSLGGDDDLDLVRAVVTRCPDLRFHVPSLAWSKRSNRKTIFDVRLDAPNVVSVDCSSYRLGLWTFSRPYRAAFARCDIVLVATEAERKEKMRGGTRVASAIHAGKYLVMTENPMCELLMGQDGQTCLVAAHTAESVSEKLQRIAGAGFLIDAALYRAIQERTTDAGKLAWMLAAPGDPDAARRSPFGRPPERLALDVRRLLRDGRPEITDPETPHPVHSVTSWNDLRVGARLSVAGAHAFVIREIANLGTRHRIRLEEEGTAASLWLLISSEAGEPYYLRTKRRHYLAYEGSDLTPEVKAAIAEVAALA